MLNSLYIAESGLNAQKSLVDVISNNIANMNTPAFKRGQVRFVQLVQQSSSGPEAVTHGVTVNSTVQNMSDGDVKPTGNPLDVAIRGKGYIAVDLPNGETGYTRAGQLSVDRDGYIAAAGGLRLTANISVPPDAKQLVIAENGIVSITIDKDPRPIVIGRITLTEFANPQGLAVARDGVYVATEDSGYPAEIAPGETGGGIFVQGYLEDSNVGLIEEMVFLMAAQRGYQLNARLVQVSDQIMETINNLSR